MKIKNIINKHKALAVIGILGLVLLVYFSIMGPTNIVGKSTSQTPSSGKSSPVVITKDNFIPIFEKQAIVKDLPKKAVISLKFYNFDSGTRQWDESYVITSSGIKLGETSEADLEIILHSKYFEGLGNFCNTIQQAKANGDIAFELKIDNVTFLWRYKGMMGYRDCFGF